MSLCWAAGLERAAGGASVIAAAGGATVSGMARGVLPPSEVPVEPGGPWRSGGFPGLRARQRRA